VIRAERIGHAVLVRDVATVRVGGDIRRGAAELRRPRRGGLGHRRDALRENALDVIRRVERKLEELRPSLPAGVEVVPVYSRAGLIERAIDTLKHALVEEMIVVSLVIILFLLHLRSALLPIVSIPLAVLASFIPLYLLGIPATIMSLGGIAIAIGATVDAEIVMVEAAHKKLEAPRPIFPRGARAPARRGRARGHPRDLLLAADHRGVVHPGLRAHRAGRALFRPLAYAKTFVMLSAAVLSVTVAPAMRDYLIRGKIYSEARHPVSRAIRAVYEPFVHVALRKPKTTVLIGLMALASALPIAGRIGSEFMPPLDEGDLVYMPTTLPTISIEEARRQLQRQDAILSELSPRWSGCSARPAAPRPRRTRRRSRWSRRR
jgi:Cu(I)/Ag(I) efflux system membrane protein CusA/SilA